MLFIALPDPDMRCHSLHYKVPEAPASPSLCRNPILIIFIILEFLCVDSWVFKQRKIPVDNSEWPRHRNERTAGCNQIHHDQCGLKEYFCFVYNISCLHGRCKHFQEVLLCRNNSNVPLILYGVPGTSAVLAMPG